jgi:quercetin dioxygenase-like cupin family protein
MKSIQVALFLAALPMAALAQDPVKVDPGHYKVLIDNAAVRVLKVGFGPGEKSPMHSHPDAIIVPLSAAKVRFTMEDGKSEDRSLTAEVADYTPAMTHAPANLGDKVDAILVEFKGAAPGTATLPSQRPGLAQKVLAEGPRATAARITAAPTFHEAAGTTHEYDQVVVALGDGEVKLAIEGQPARTAWHRGDVAFIGRGVKHESQNTSGKPFDYVIVAVK